MTPWTEAGLPLSQLIDRQASATPGVIAVQAAEGELTYAELTERAARLAQELRARGVVRGSVVGVCLDRGLDLVVTLIAVMKAGAAYLPMATDDPPDRIAFMLRDSAAALVVTRSALVSRLPDGARVIALDGDAGAIAARPPATPETGLTLDDLVYVIYTSGSTGVPKGVLVPYRGVVNRVLWMQQVHHLTAAGRVLQKTPYTFDVSVWEFFWPLVCGGRLVMAPPGAHKDPLALAGLISSYGITHVHFVPSMLEAFLDVVPEFPACVEKVFCSGEALRPGAARTLLSRSRAILYNLYGPTEASIEVTACTVSRDDDPVPIGRPIDNVTTRIFDDELALTPDGETGELCLGGACVAWGYASRPRLTAERFVPDPCGDRPGARMYRSGDRTRRRPDGQIEFLGRADGQVKLRGLRIELGEIETALTAHPAVASAAVTLTEPPTADPFLAAYLVAASDARLPDPGELRVWLARQLPAYMIPTRFVPLPQMPLTSSGKTDRGSLPPVQAAAGVPAAGEPAGEGRAPAAPDPAGSSAAHRAVAQAWQEVFGIGGVDADRDFFETGGNSLLAARLVARVSARLGVSLPAAALLENPTIRGLARVAETAPAAAPPPSGSAAVEGPLAPGQQRLWLASQLDGGLAAYNIPAVIDLRGPLNIDLLRAALDLLLARHEALRTAFVRDQGEVIQRITPAASLDLLRPDSPGPRDTSSGSTGPGNTGGWERWTHEFAARPFDLTRPPLIRAALLPAGPGRHRLVLSLHHLVSDASTLNLLLTDLGVIYSALAQGSEPPPAAAPFRYLDYAAGQARRLRDGEFDGQLSYWRDQLADLPAPVWLPAATGGASGQPGGAGQAGEAIRCTVRLGGSLPAALRGLAARHRTTLFVTLLAGFAAQLHRWSGQDDLVIGAPFGERTVPGTEQLAGFFVSTVALRLRQVTDESSFSALVEQARTVTRQATANQDMPFDLVQHKLGRGGLGVPFRVWFNWLGEPPPAPRMAGLTAEHAGPPVIGALFDLNVYLTEELHNIRVDLVFDRSRLDPAHLEQFLAQYETLLRRAASDENAPVGACGPTGDTGTRARSHALVVDPPALGVPVAEQARSEPARPAVVSAACRVSYGELAAWAGGIAGTLRAAGTGPGDVVAVYAQRDPSLVAAMLGVLEAGAAFCLLDPGYPARRLAAQLRAARPAALLALAAAGPVPDELRRLAPLVHEIAAAPAAGAPIEGLPGNRLAYVAFTSGSTAEPKAVHGDHAPVAHFIEHYRSSFGLGPGDRFALLSGLGHDPLLRDVFVPLQAGASLHIPPPSALREPGELLDWLAAERITVAHVTPPLIRLLAGAGQGRGLPALRLVVSGGDTLRGTDVATLRALAPEATVLNAYGTTETPQIVAWQRIPPGLPWASGPDAVPIGTGIDGFDLDIARADGQPADVGELGLLIVRSPYLSREYLAGGEFASGDLGRRLPDGRLALAGRADRQVQVRGFRVDPAGLDLAVRALPGIADCVTVPRTGPDGETALVVYAVPAPGQDVSPGRLRDGLKSALPAHMLPAGLVTLARLPLTPNGKIDTAALPAWAPGRPAPGHDPAEAPATALEKLIASVWQEVLRTEDISASASFFDLGGSSLLMATAGQRLTRELGQPVAVLTLFEHPTVRALAAHLEGSQDQAGPAPARRRLVTADAERRRAIRQEISVGIQGS